MELIQSFTPEAFAGYTALGAALIIPTVELVRAHVLKTLHGAYVVLLSVGIGAAYGALGGVAGYVEGGVVAAIAFGAWAGLLASGANKFLDKMTHPKIEG